MAKMIHSHNFVDFDDLDAPLKRSVTDYVIDKRLSQKVLEVDAKLLIHQASFDKNLLNPLQDNESIINYLYLNAILKEELDITESKLLAIKARNHKSHQIKSSNSP